MARPPDTGSDLSDLIGELVHQFSDPFAFYRELIQNSIDAGSSRIEVTLRYHPGQPSGMATVQVSDWGEGMTRAIIEEFLVTKFRSSKEGDLTKIGKFGIGFLSVFAPAPDLVVVETGRDGEDWRVLFHPDRTYELLKSPEPIEGTRVLLHKEMGVPDYRELARRSEDAVRRWCRHSEVDVAFAAGGEDGSPPAALHSVREPLVADAPFQVEHREEHLCIVAGPARRDPPLCGFYNRGLTLLETREPLVPGVSFKAVSDHLEHTLTRDNVRRDRGFEKVVDRVRKLARGPLRKRLPEELHAAAARPEPGDDYRVLLTAARGVLDATTLRFPLLPTGTVDGATLARSAKEVGHLLFGRENEPLAEALVARGVPVLPAAWREVAAVLEAAREAAGRPDRDAAEAFSLAEIDSASTAAQAMTEALARILRECGIKVARVAIARLHGAGSERLFLRVSQAERPEPAEKAQASLFERDAPRLLCLNARLHPVTHAVALAQRDPRLAAYLLARLIAVTERALDEGLEHRMLVAVLS